MQRAKRLSFFRYFTRITSDTDESTNESRQLTNGRRTRNRRKERGGRGVNDKYGRGGKRYLSILRNAFPLVVPPLLV